LHADAVVPAISVGAAGRTERAIANADAGARIADERPDARVDTHGVLVAPSRGPALIGAKRIAVHVCDAVLRDSFDLRTVEIDLARRAVRSAKTDGLDLTNRGAPRGCDVGCLIDCAAIKTRAAVVVLRAVVSRAIGLSVGRRNAVAIEALVAIASRILESEI